MKDNIKKYIDFLDEEKEDKTEMKDEYKKKIYDNVKKYNKKITIKKVQIIGDRP